MGVVPPEWQPEHPSDAMPFLCASALADAKDIARQLTIDSQRDCLISTTGADDRLRRSLGFDHITDTVSLWCPLVSDSSRKT